MPKRRKNKRKLKKGGRTRHFYLYALSLEDDCYYVGMTAYKDAVERFNQHKEGLGSKWTTLHRPVELIEVRDIGVLTESQAAHAENLMAFEYIHKYGLKYVRGGKLCYVSEDLCKTHYNKYSPVVVV